MCRNLQPHAAKHPPIPQPQPATMDKPIPPQTAPSADSVTEQLRALSCVKHTATEAPAEPSGPLATAHAMVPATTHANDPPIEPAEPSGPATADATDPPIELLALPRDVLATIVSKLGRRSARMLASTSTSALSSRASGVCTRSPWPLPYCAACPR